MKKTVSLALAAVLSASFLLSGCSSTQSTVVSQSTPASQQAQAAVVDDKGYSSTFDVSSAGDVTLDVMITSLGDSDGGPYLRGVMDAYMEMYPNVTLTPVECSMNDLYTTLITRTTSNTLPDIFTMSEAYSANCLEMGMCVDNLTELLGDDYMNGLLDAAVENSTVNGTFVYMPWQNNTTAMVYRKDLYEEKGLEIPTTWDEFLSNAKALTEDTNGDGQTEPLRLRICGHSQ